MFSRRQALASAAVTGALALLDPLTRTSPTRDPTWSAAPFERKDYARLCWSLGLASDKGHLLAVVREGSGYRAKRYDQLRPGDVYRDLAIVGPLVPDDGKGPCPDNAYVVLDPAEKLPEGRFYSVMVDFCPRSRWS